MSTIKVVCPTCNGAGFIQEPDPNNPASTVAVQCSQCGGAGTVTETLES